VISQILVYYADWCLDKTNCIFLGLIGVWIRLTVCQEGWVGKGS
jgi:hypothetical protein